jgi:hypothetical protein
MEEACEDKEEHDDDNDEEEEDMDVPGSETTQKKRRKLSNVHDHFGVCDNNIEYKVCRVLVWKVVEGEESRVQRECGKTLKYISTKDGKKKKTVKGMKAHLRSIHGFDKDLNPPAQKQTILEINPEKCNQRLRLPNGMLRIKGPRTW